MTAIEIIRANPGLTAPELARRFGKTRNAYHDAAMRHGIALPKTSIEERNMRVRLGRSAQSAGYEAYIRQHYGSMSAKDIAEVLGIHHGSVCNIAKRIGIKRTPEQQEYFAQLRRRKIGETVKKRKAYAYAMQLSGDALPTKHYNVFYSNSRARVMSRLNLTYGYIRIAGDNANLGYDRTTDRCTEARHSGGPCRKSEEYYTKKYGIKFYNLDNDE